MARKDRLEKAVHDLQHLLDQLTTRKPRADQGKPRRPRATVIDAAQVRRLLAEGVPAAEIAKRLGICRSSVYRLKASA